VVQGAGKTTTVAKYALHYSRARYKTCMVCADTFRAGAFEQLKVCAGRLRLCLSPPCVVVFVCTWMGTIECVPLRG
jgi:signal recognition particle GTPase